MKKVISAAKLAVIKRDKKILHLYDTRKGNYDQVTILYFKIAELCGCSFPTVTRVLKANGRIQDRNTAE